MDKQILLAFLITFLAGLCTSIGGVLTFFIKKDDLKVLALGLSFSAGVMIFISFNQILPFSSQMLTESLGQTKGSLFSLLFFFFGILIGAFVDFLLPDHVTQSMIKKTRRTKLTRAGLLTAVAIGIHNFPEGLITFATGVKSITLSIPIAFAIALHNIPEGISVALPIYNATGKKRQAFLWSTLAGLTEPIGAILGFALLRPFLNDFTFGFLFAVIAGIMIYISLDELLPMAKEYDQGHQGIIGVTLGMMVMGLSLIFLK